MTRVGHKSVESRGVELQRPVGARAKRASEQTAHDAGIPAGHFLREFHADVQALYNIRNIPPHEAVRRLDAALPHLKPSAMTPEQLQHLPSLLVLCSRGLDRAAKSAEFETSNSWKNSGWWIGRKVGKLSGASMLADRVQAIGVRIHELGKEESAESAKRLEEAKNGERKQIIATLLTKDLQGNLNSLAKAVAEPGAYLIEASDWARFSYTGALREPDPYLRLRGPGPESDDDNMHNLDAFILTMSGALRNAPQYHNRPDLVQHLVTQALIQHHLIDAALEPHAIERITALLAQKVIDLAMTE